MTFLFIICFIAVVVGVGSTARMGWNRHDAIKATGLKYKELQTYSWPAQRILRLYKQLPPESQFGSIEPILRAMDTKHDIGEINRHFRQHSSEGGSYYAWECGCFHSERCMAVKYKNLKEQITGIQSDLKDREHEIELAGLQHDLNQYDELLSKLASERDAIRSGTKESVKELT